MTDAFGAVSPVPVAPEQKLFTVEEANRALTLVRRIVSDIVQEVRALLATEELHRAAEARYDRPALEALKEKRSAMKDRLQELADELSDIGVLLKDARTGLVDFPAGHDGRVVYLCWKLGEDKVAFWHEVDTGYAGRQPIDHKSW